MSPSSERQVTDAVLAVGRFDQAQTTRFYELSIAASGYAEKAIAIRAGRDFDELMAANAKKMERMTALEEENRALDERLTSAFKRRDVQQRLIRDVEERTEAREAEVERRVKVLKNAFRANAEIVEQANAASDTAAKVCAQRDEARAHLDQTNEQLAALKSQRACAVKERERVETSLKASSAMLARLLSRDAETNEQIAKLEEQERLNQDRIRDYLERVRQSEGQLNQIETRLSHVSRTARQSEVTLKQNEAKLLQAQRQSNAVENALRKVDARFRETLQRFRQAEMELETLVEHSMPRVKRSLEIGKEYITYMEAKMERLERRKDECRNGVLDRVMDMVLMRDRCLSASCASVKAIVASC